MAGKNIDMRMQRHRNILLDILRLEPQSSRSSLKQLSGLSMDTVLRTVDKMLKDHLIYESGSSQGQIGRKATWLSIDPSGRFFIGLKFNRSLLSGVLLDFQGRVVRYEACPFPEPLSTHILVDSLTRVIDALSGCLSGGERDRLCGIGIGASGIVDRQAGIVHRYVGIPDLHDLPLKDIVEEHTGLPTWVDHTMRITALAHKMRKENAGIADVLYVILRGGVGMVTVLDNRIHLGADGAAGEIGHVRVPDAQRPCGCGRRGCLESEIGHAAIVEDMRAGVRQGRFAYLQNSERDITVQDLAAGVACGDADARQLMQTVCATLSDFVVKAAAMLNPQMIVCIGEIPSMPGFLPALRAAVERDCPPFVTNGIRWEVENFDDKTDAMGAAFLPMSQEFGCWGDAWQRDA